MPETWPSDIIARDAEFWIQAHTAQFESPLNRVRQVQGFPAGQRWCMRMELFIHRDKPSRPARRLGAFLTRLRGPQGTFRCWDHDRPEPANPILSHEDWVAEQTYPEPFGDATLFSDGTGFTVAGRPLTLRLGAERGLTELALDGWEPEADGLVEGDRVGIDGYLYEVVADAEVDGNGQFTLTIEPPLRAAVTQASVIVLERPTAEFRLVDDDQARNPSDNVHFYRYSINAVEVL